MNFNFKVKKIVHKTAAFILVFGLIYCIGHLKNHLFNAEQNLLSNSKNYENLLVEYSVFVIKSDQSLAQVRRILLRNRLFSVFSHELTIFNTKSIVRMFSR